MIKSWGIYSSWIVLLWVWTSDLLWWIGLRYIMMDWIGIIVYSFKLVLWIYFIGFLYFVYNKYEYFRFFSLAKFGFMAISCALILYPIFHHILDIFFYFFLVYPKMRDEELFIIF